MGATPSRVQGGDPYWSLKGEASRKTDLWGGTQPKKLKSFACLTVNVAPNGRPDHLNVVLLSAYGNDGMLIWVPFYRFFLGGALRGPPDL